MYRRRPEATHIKLHAQHGDIVRLGPNALSFADPKALKVIYGLNKGFTKVRASLLSTLVNNVNTNQIYSPSSTLCNSL